MSSIAPGTQYSIVANDWLSKIAGRAYGDIYNWKIIESANPQLNGRDTALDGSPLLFPGDVLWIPIDNPVEVDTDQLTFVQQQEDSFSLTVDGELVSVMSASLLVTMDTGADFFEARIDIENISEKVRSALIPFKYPQCTVRINGELRLTGAVYDISVEVSSSGKVKTIKGYSNTIDLVDSAVNPPLVQSSVTLKNRADTLCSGMGIRAVFRAGESELFDKVTARSGEKRFSHLVRLARERGILVSNTASGNLLFLKPSTDKSPIGIITEGNFDSSKLSANYIGRKKFSSYRVTGKSIVGVAVTSTITDKDVSRARFYVSGSQGDQGSVSKSAKWERSRAAAEAMSIELPYNSWVSNSGELWREDRYVQVTSKTLDITTPVLLIIRRIKYVFSPKGKTVLMNVCPPEVFSEDPVPNIWG